MSTNDPFHPAHSDLLRTLTTVRSLLSSHRRILSTSKSPSNPEVIESRSELSTALQDLGGDLQDLSDSVDAVQGDPARYGLDAGEVRRRRGLVDGVRRDMLDLQGQVRSLRSSGGELPDPAAFDDGLDLEERGEDGEDNYEAWEEQRQDDLFREQDDQLEGVSRTIGNLRAQADVMGRELEEQDLIIEEVDGLTDRVQGKVQNGLKRVGVLVRQNEDTYSSCCIGVLIFVLILLLVIVLFI